MSHLTFIIFLLFIGFFDDNCNNNTINNNINYNNNTLHELPLIDIKPESYDYIGSYDFARSLNIDPDKSEIELLKYILLV